MNHSYGEFKDVIHNRMRIFLGQQEAHNVSVWFKNQDIEADGIITQEKLSALATLPEFQQLLFEASMKLTEVIFSLENLIEQNNKLRDILNREISESG